MSTTYLIVATVADLTAHGPVLTPLLRDGFLIWRRFAHFPPETGRGGLIIHLDDQDVTAITACFQEIGGSALAATYPTK